MRGRNEYDRLATKIIHCNRECNSTPTECFAMSFNVDECTILKTTSIERFDNLLKRMRERNENIRCHMCRCEKRIAESGKIQQFINRQEVSLINDPGGENESINLWEKCARNLAS